MKTTALAALGICVVMGGLAQPVTGQGYCPGFCFESYCPYLSQDGHYYRYLGPVHIGLMEHGCGGQPSCIMDHPDCPDGLIEAILPDASMDAYRDMTGEQLFDLTERFEGVIAFNEDRRSLQLFSCLDPTAVVANFPLSDPQVKQLIAARGAVDSAP